MYRKACGLTYERSSTSGPLSIRRLVSFRSIYLNASGLTIGRQSIDDSAG